MILGGAELGGAELAAGLSLAGVLVLAALGALLLRLRRERTRAERAAAFGEGAVLLVEDGRVLDASEEAARLLGGVDGAGAGNRASGLAGLSAREVIRGFLDSCRAEALAALDRLERTGEAFEVIAGDHADRRFALSGRPRGGQLRLELRDASLIDSELARARQDAASRVTASRERDVGAAALGGLVADGPLIAWSRAADGTVAWSAGRIVTRTGPVEAGVAAAMAAARRAPHATAHSGAPDGAGAGGERGPGKAERFRLEIQASEDGGASALEAVEVPAEGGGFHGLATDAASTVEAERTLARFVRTMTETFAHLNVGLGVFDRNQKLAMFNPALVEMWQADPAWLARRPSLREILDRLRANRRAPEAADFRAWRGRLTGLFENTEAADYDEIWHLADGSDIRVLARPHPNSSLAFVFEDVTERLRLEQQYRHSIELRRATLNRLEEGLAVFGPNGRLQFVNAAFHDIWGTDSETVRSGMHVRELVPVIGGMTVETAVWEQLTGFITGAGSRQPWGLRLTLGTGRILGARVAGLPDGATMAVFGDVTDSERIAQALTERNQALEAAEDMRTAVLDQISHRLRTPLHSIFGFGQLLVDPRFGSLSETQRQHAEQILDSARQLLAAVDDVTELATLEVGPLRGEGAEATLGDTLLATARLLEKRATAEGVTLSVSLPEAELRPACEPARLSQIVFGLATAAIGSCREAGTVELGARRGEGSVELVVSLDARGRGPDGALPPECPSLPFIRRLLEQAGGAIETTFEAAAARITVRCRLPAAGAAALPPPERMRGNG